MPRVLLAEDEFLIRAVVVESLASVGIDCIEAATGKAALDVLAGGSPLSAIIVDIGLPDMSGEKVIEAALQHRPGVPIICCSGGSVPSEVADPGTRVFLKPYSADELSRYVASLVGDG